MNIECAITCCLGMWQDEQFSFATGQILGFRRAPAVWQEMQGFSRTLRPPATLPCGSWQAVQRSPSSVSLKQWLSTSRWLGKRTVLGASWISRMSAKIGILRGLAVADTAHLRLRESVEGAGVENLLVGSFRILHGPDVFRPRAVTALAAHAHIVARRLRMLRRSAGRVAAQAFDEILFAERAAHAF